MFILGTLKVLKVREFHSKNGANPNFNTLGTSPVMMSDC